MVGQRMGRTGDALATECENFTQTARWPHPRNVENAQRKSTVAQVTRESRRIRKALLPEPDRPRAPFSKPVFLKSISSSFFFPLFFWRNKSVHSRA